MALCAPHQARTESVSPSPRTLYSGEVRAKEEDTTPGRAGIPSEEVHRRRANFAEDLQTLTDKAYPELQVEASAPGIPAQVGTPPNFVQCEAATAEDPRRSGRGYP